MKPCVCGALFCWNKCFRRFYVALFNKKFRVESARKEDSDYGSSAIYFVTICTQNRLPFFGNIWNGVMNLNAIGLVVEREWLNTPLLRPDMNLTLHAHVVMPNHFHGVVEIGQNKFNTRRDAMLCVSTPQKDLNVSTPQTPSVTNAFQPQSKNLAAIMRGFKSAVTIQARTIDKNFGWQERYHDRIVRNREEFLRIVDYINKNVERWRDDRFHF
jgi:putative transposase